MNNAIEVEHLVVSRGGRPVLHDLSCAVPAGSVTGLLGPSGSGKTTLMRAIVGVQLVKSGTVTVLGRPAGSKPLRDKVGYLTQAPSVYADLSVRDNARYFGRLYGVGLYNVRLQRQVRSGHRSLIPSVAVDVENPWNHLTQPLDADGPLTDHPQR